MNVVYERWLLQRPEFQSITKLEKKNTAAVSSSSAGQQTYFMTLCIREQGTVALVRYY
jgi:hypothetical protein